MSDEQKDNSAFHLAREKERSKALLHALAASGEKICELALERDSHADHYLRIDAALGRQIEALVEEQRQHEETKRELRARKDECDAWQRTYWCRH